MKTLVAEYRIMPDQGIHMQISLLNNGVAEIHLEGLTAMPCWCGHAHAYRLEATLRCDSTMELLDMNDLEACIHGDERAARRFGWRLMHRLFVAETPPCEKGE